MNDFEPTFARRRHLSRRALINLSVGLAVVAAATSWGLLRPALAQKRAAAGRTEVSVEELMKPGPLPDLVLGKEDAPDHRRRVCLHDLRPLRQLPQQGFPGAQGKVHRHRQGALHHARVPLDNLAAAASMLARCAGGDKTFPLISALFAKQDEWAFVRSDPRAGALQVRQAGRLHPGELRQMPDRPEADG